MKIIIDSGIPYIKGVFEPYAQVIYSNKITPEQAKDAHALIIRTTTQCNEQLLKNSSVQFIATATIGYDHIDTLFCAQNGIEWASAAGCNSQAVADYVLSALALLAVKNNFNLSEKTLGIVGVGNIGKKVAHIAHQLGMRVLLNDPPRQAKESGLDWHSLSEIAEQADIITFHTPLQTSGEYATYHLADEFFFGQTRQKPFVINTSRGEVCCNQSLFKAIVHNQISGVVLDVWENEPHIHTELLAAADIATYHIAGYSARGKYNASQMSIQAVAHFFGWSELQFSLFEETEIKIKPFTHLDTTHQLHHVCKHLIDLESETQRLKKDNSLFNTLRSSYPLRPDSLQLNAVDVLKLRLFKDFSENA